MKKKSVIIILVIITLVFVINASWRSIVPGTWEEVTVHGWTIDRGDGFAQVKVETVDGNIYWYNCFDTEGLHVGDIIEVKFTNNGHIINDRW